MRFIVPTHPARTRLTAAFRLPLLLVIMAAGAGRTSAQPLDLVFSQAGQPAYSAPAVDLQGRTLGSVTLAAVPEPLAPLIAIDNTGPDPITGRFGNVADGDYVDAVHGTTTYRFVAGYSGGPGANDFILTPVGPGVPIPGNLLGDLSGPVTAIVPEDDGSLVIAGEERFHITNTTTKVDSLIRMKPDGTRDLSFAPNLRSSFGEPRVRTLHRLPSGKYLIGGRFDFIGSTYSSNVAILNADGSADESFYSRVTGEVNTAVAQPDGKILVGGTFSFTPNTHHRIVRLDTDGWEDGSFDADLGGTGIYSVVKIRLLPDGKILVAGSFTTAGGSAAGTKFVRLLPSGALDPTFNAGLASTDDAVSAAVLPDGGILLGKMTDPYLIRLDATGALAATHAHTDAPVHSIVVQEDGKVLIGGDFTVAAGRNTQGVVRLNADGTLDTPFHSWAENSIRSIGIAGDDTVLAAGGAYAAGAHRSGLLRLANEPPQSTTTVDGDHTIRWTRSPGAPLAHRARFEIHGFGSSGWTPLGDATRVNGKWEISGLTLPPLALIRGVAELTVDDSSYTTHTLLTTIGAPSPQLTVRDGSGAELGEDSAVSIARPVMIPLKGSTILSLESTGTAALEGISYTFTGPHAEDFSFSSDPNLSVTRLDAPSAVSLPDLVFTPSGTGIRTAVLVITSNDPARPALSLQLQGEGTRTFSPHFDSPSDVYMTGPSFDASQIAIGTVTLGFAPAPYQVLTAFQSTDGVPITGRFTGGVPEGDRISGSYGGQTYEFLIQYYPNGDIFLHRIWKGMPDYNFQPQDIGRESTGIGPWKHLWSPASDRMNFLLKNGAVDLTMPRNLVHRDPGLVHVQDDGKFFSILQGQLVRWNADGTTDNTFVPVEEYASRVIQLRDGRLVFGAGSGSGVNIRFTLPDGTPDPATPPVPWGKQAYAIAQQPDGKILVAGGTSGIVRLHLDGTTDATFQFTTARTPTTQPAYVTAILPLPDGKILAAGHFTTANGDANQRYLVRLNADGTTDTSFTAKVDGIVTALMRLNDGRIFAGGDFMSSTGPPRPASRSGFASFLPDGALDPEYNLMAPFSPSPFNQVRAINMLWDGSILLSGGIGTASYIPVSLELAKFLNTSLVSTVTVTPGTGITWTRNGEAADFMYTTFEYRGDGETTWTPLGDGMRGGAGEWFRPHTGTLPASGFIRVKGRLNTTNRASTVIMESHLFGRAQLTPLEQWRKDHFGDPINDGPAAATADADKDGVPNLAEYALGLRPDVANPSSALPQWIAKNGGHEITFTPPAGAPVTSGAEWSTSLRADDWHPAEDISSGGAGEKTFRVPDTAAAPDGKVFFRLKFTE